MNPATLNQLSIISTLTEANQENPTLDWTSSAELARGFADYNLGLGVPAETQAEVDHLLSELSEVDPRTADHGRRSGGYAGATVRALGGGTFHQGIARVSVSLHDIGKKSTEPSTLHRSWGDAGWGLWSDDRDMPAISRHPKDGYKLLENNPFLPPETKYIAGCHHQYPDPLRTDRPVYGVELSQIDQDYAHDPAMRDWVHLLVKVAVAADVYDSATHRNNSYLQGNEVYAYLVRRLQPLFPGEWQQVLHALQEEHLYYHLQVSEAADPQK